MKIYHTLKTAILSILLLVMCITSYSQSNDSNIKGNLTKFHECGTSDSIADKSALKYYGNNKYLLGILKNNNINVDSTYYDNPSTMMKYNSSSFNARSSLYSSVTTFKYIPIKIWVYRRNDGSGAISQATIENHMAYLNSFYSNQTNLRFYMLCDITYINNDSYYQNPSYSQSEDMLDNNWQSGVLNVHFIYDNNQYGGIAHLPSISKPYSCIVCWNQFNSQNTLCHEIGHTLGLLHTHANNLIDRCTQESVSRTRLQELGCAGWDTQSKNCDVNGDYLCDTQSDPDLSNYPQNSCSYYGLGNDYWGDPFQTDASNIMSYATRNCRTSVTLSQIAIMNDNLPSGTNTYGPSFNISGPNTLCSNQSGTFSISPIVAGAANYYWSVPSGWSILSGQGSSTVTLLAPNDNGGTISVLPSCGSVSQTKLLYPPITNMNISGQTQLCPNSTYYFSVQDSPGLTYNWNIQGNASISSGQGQSSILLFTSSTFSGGQISVSTNNSCTGATVMTSQTLQPNFGCRSKGRLAFQEETSSDASSQIYIYPNPVKSSLYLIDSRSEFSNINIYDIKGNKLNLPSERVGDQKTIIDTSRLQSGTYVIESQTDKKKDSKRFIVE